MTVHTKWEILVQKLLKSVELFKSYGLFGFLEKCKKNDIFGPKYIIFTT